MLVIKWVPNGTQNGACLEAWANVKTALPSRRELNLALQMCAKGRAKSDGNLEHVGKELPKHSRRSHGCPKDAWRSLGRPEDPVGPGAHPKALDLASWIFKDIFIWESWKSGKLEFWEFGTRDHAKNKKTPNPNPCVALKYRQGLDS